MGRVLFMQFRNVLPPDPLLQIRQAITKLTAMAPPDPVALRPMTLHKGYVFVAYYNEADCKIILQNATKFQAFQLDWANQPEMPLHFANGWIPWRAFLLPHDAQAQPGPLSQPDIPMMQPEVQMRSSTALKVPLCSDLSLDSPPKQPCSVDPPPKQPCPVVPPMSTINTSTAICMHCHYKLLTEFQKFCHNCGHGFTSCHLCQQVLLSVDQKFCHSCGGTISGHV